MLGENGLPSFFEPDNVFDNVLVEVWKHPIQRSTNVLALISVLEDL